MTEPWARGAFVGAQPLGADVFGLRTRNSAYSAKAMMAEPLHMARLGLIDTLRPSLTPILAQAAVLGAHQSAVEALNAPMRRAVQGLARLHTAQYSLGPPSGRWATAQLIGTGATSSWSKLLSPYAHSGLLNLTRSVPTFPASRIPALSRQLALINAEAFRAIPAARAAELFRGNRDAAGFEHDLRTDPDLGAAVEEVVESEAVTELFDYLEELRDLEVDGLSDPQTTQLRQDLVTRLIIGLAGRLDNVPITLTPTIIVSMFAALHSLVVATTLQVRGQDELVGQVADTVAWPLGVLGVLGFVLAIKAGHQHNEGDDQAR